MTPDVLEILQEAATIEVSNQKQLRPQGQRPNMPNGIPNFHIDTPFWMADTVRIFYKTNPDAESIFEKLRQEAADTLERTWTQNLQTS